MPWRKWGPYLSERQWGTVREDYSDDGDAWDYFSHDQARSRAYRWGEDGLAGISDDQQRLCFALALWNGKDPILKERLFGLTNSEGNHGEDVKEYYFYLDSHADALVHEVPLQVPAGGVSRTTTSSRPTAAAAATSSSTSCSTPASSTRTATSTCSSSTPRRRPRTSSIQITVHNRGPEAADAARPADALVPQHLVVGRRRRPAGAAAGRGGRAASIAASHPELGERFLYCDGAADAAVHRERDQHRAALRRRPTARPYVKDGINNYVVHGQQDAVNPEQTGTKAAAHYRADGRAPAESQVIRLRLSDAAPARPRRQRQRRPFGSDFDARDRRRGGRRPTSSTPTVIPPSLDADAANVMRQALAGMLWTKQFYHYDVDNWLEERGADPFKPTRKAGARATTTGTTCTTPTSSRCRTSGSTPGTRPGTWPSTSSR